MRRFGAITALVILTVVAGWCGYSALPHYGYYYQVAIQSPENLNNLELYLPVGTVSGEPYTELLNQPLRMPQLTGDYTLDMVDTDYGRMVKLTTPALKKDAVPQPRYTANIIFWQKSAPRQLMQLTPGYDVTPLNAVSWQRSFGPVKSHESLIVARFRVPVKIVSSTPGQIKLTLWNRTDRDEAVNFTYSKSYPYTERISYDMQTGNEWVFVPVEATIVMEIRGISD